MITSRPGGPGSVVTTLGTATPASAQLSILDSAGRLVVRRRFHERNLAVALAPGVHTFSVEDERSLHDPRRQAGSTVVLVVPTGSGRTAVDLSLTPGAVIRASVMREGAPARNARVRAAHSDGHVVDARTDGVGTVTLCGLRAGTWTLEATDARRTSCTTPLAVTVGVGDHDRVTLDLDSATSDLLVRVTGAGARSVDATSVTATTVAGGRVTAALTNGCAHLRGLRPGAQTITVPASVGHLGATIVVPDLAPGGLGMVEAVVPVGASVVGRVVGSGSRGRLAAVVSLLDEVGREVERVRTDDRGCFVLGTGLGSLDGCTVVATSGPETLRVTRVAIADLTLVAGVRHDVGLIRLPAADRLAAWAPLDRAIAAMKLPSTRV